VDLPVLPPIEPMLAKAQTKVPPEAGVWFYEPKWDAFTELVKIFQVNHRDLVYEPDQCSVKAAGALTVSPHAHSDHR
jgi:hypothetical protein